MRIFLTCVPRCSGIPAWAALGQPHESIKSDVQNLKGKLVTREMHGYSVKEITRADGSVLREFVSPQANFRSCVAGIDDAQSPPDTGNFRGRVSESYTGGSHRGPLSVHVGQLWSRPAGICERFMFVLPAGPAARGSPRIWCNERGGEGHEVACPSLALCAGATVLLSTSGCCAGVPLAAAPTLDRHHTHAAYGQQHVGDSGRRRNIQQLFQYAPDQRHDLCTGHNHLRIVPNVLVDTGSTGLRILASSLTISLPVARIRPATRLATVRPLRQYYAWGPVATADVELAGETASRCPSRWSMPRTFRRRR